MKRCAGRWHPVLAGLRIVVACCALTACGPAAGDAADHGDAAPPPPPQRETPGHSIGVDAAWSPGDGGLRVAVQEVDGRGFVLFAPARLAIRLERPEPDDPRITLAVAGTYTDVDDAPMGLFAIDGVLVRPSKMGWEGVLRIDARGVSIRRAGPGAFDLDASTSILQGHLLVDGGKPRPLRPSAALYRRAIIVDDAGTFAIVDGREPQTLPAFADDLVGLGATAALNLDMGAWSGGFYRDPQSHAVQALGHDVSATHRQSNWLVAYDR